MSDLEASKFQGRPVLLYQFQRTSNGVDFFWRYNTSDRDLEYGEAIYKAVPISDDGVKLSSEGQSTNLIVKMPIMEDFPRDFRFGGTMPSDSVWLRVRRAQGDEIANLDGEAPTVVGDVPITWVGTVDGISQTDEITAQITCSMISASLNRSGLRYGYQRNCPHVLYAAQGCRANKELFRVTAAISYVDRQLIRADVFGTYQDGWFNGGWVEYQLPHGPYDRRMIIGHSGDTIRVAGFLAGLTVARTVWVFPGCDRTFDTCQAKFDNLPNYGGFTDTPGRNPFDGQPLF